MKPFLIAFTALLAFSACKRNKTSFDASGAFEANETIMASEASGTIRRFDLEEGQVLKAGQFIGYIDSVQLYLKKKQLISQAKAVLGKKPNVTLQLAALEAQLKAAQHEQERVANMVKADAATPKQLDDVTAQVDVFNRQIDALKSSLDITTEGLSLETNPVYLQIRQIEDQLQKCRIVNPVQGTVLVKYTEVNEVAMPGKPLYKIADLSYLTLRAYITSAQLAQVKLNQQVKVAIDNGPDAFRELPGTITWISDKAEFTPKTIQTKEERANLVYAIKIKVANDGALKIGMYGEVVFH